MKKIIIGIAVSAVAAIGIYLAYGKNGQPVKYKTATVERGELKASIMATGAVNPVKSVLIGTQVSGTIKKIYVDFNSTVHRGDRLADIDPNQIEAQLEQSKANLQAAEANREKALATLNDSKRTLNRQTGLMKAGVVSASDLDAAQTNNEFALAQLTAAEAQVAQAQAAVRYAETNLHNTRIVSPVDGTVVARNVDVGQTVAASFQTPTLFTIAQDLKKMQIDSNVNEADIGKVANGQSVEFTVDAFPETVFRGAVEQIRIAPTVIQNVVTYDVVVRVDNKDLKLKPGMTANVSIITAVIPSALKVPNAALRWKPETQNGQNTPQKPEGRGVWTPVNGAPQRVPVTLGASDGSFTEILSGNLKEGQEVIMDTAGKPRKEQSSHRMF
ncbi:MAG: efflux RND transporter periplasmic adaptor subunit [Nitrospinae bacterium]|nr:efflux RND transporter periplasmic adaptor subunit [Nitrospinota bacterium]